MRVDTRKLEMPGTPVSLVAFVNAPEGGKVSGRFSNGRSMAHTTIIKQHIPHFMLLNGATSTITDTVKLFFGSLSKTLCDYLISSALD